ncbi:poly [ADP-ribose] polymerase tankyrase-like [Gigantopelta aegis]|uniref:poly [ADP-ribose] polymerase tankyrase-like n=1 Tax=Gigantopelta aegis TaxID=1735272 RepID=UPI001B88B72C|nr:poly [ADP-ribose] polymerase tankyrase-like [Gigantopelta aegis]
MLPSLMKKLSRTLSLTRSSSTPDKDKQSTMLRKERSNKAEDCVPRSPKELSLRRQTTQTLTDDSGTLFRKSSKHLETSKMERPPSKRIRMIKTASGSWEKSVKMSTRSRMVSKTLSKRLSSASRMSPHAVNIVRAQSSGSCQMSKKISTAGKISSQTSSVKAPSKHVTKTLSKQLSSASQTSSHTHSAEQIVKTVSKRLSSAAKSSSHTSKIAASGRKPSCSVKTTAGRKEKVLWYLRETYVTVRNDEGGWFLCRLAQKAYNTSKSVQIRWLSVRTGQGGDENTYKLDYADEIDPGCILLNVRVERTGSRYHLLPADKLETDRLATLANRIAKGEATMDELDSDVEEVIQIEPPPAKKRKLDSASEKKKKRDTTRGKKEQKNKKERKKKEPKEKKQKKETGGKGEPKRKKPTKKELELMLHPKPNIKVQEKDIFFETNTPVPFVSKYAHSKLAFRAVIMKNTKLLKKLLKDNVNIYKLYHNRSVMVTRNALMEAIIQDNREAVDLLMKDYFFDVYKDRLKNNFPDKILINKMDTGMYNFRSLGLQHVRQVMAGRGSREGNNALIKDLSDMERQGYFIGETIYISFAIKHGADFDLIKMLSRGFEDDKQMCQLNAVQALEDSMVYGHHLLAAKFLQREFEGYRARFSKLHLEVLKAGEEDEISCSPYQVRAILKSYGKISPVHCAAINPNKKHLEELLSVESDYHSVDRKGRRPVHFAAACSSTGPLEYLLDRGADLFDTDSQGQTPLFYAIRANRPHNVALLLETANKDHSSMFSDPAAAKFGVGRVNKPNKSEKAPIHVAVEEGYMDIVKVLLKHGAKVDLPQAVSKFKVTPLMIASGCGHLPLARFLVQQGATVQLRDRLGRSSVIHAAMNGSSNVLSYLLNIGADPHRGDNSTNTPLHYASAYGWYFCVKLLLEAGANANVANDWKTTPTSIAYMKGHLGIVNLLLTEAGVDTNFQDDQGMTLLSTACSSVLYSELYDQIIYLVEDNGAVCTLHDVSGNTPLHHLASSSILLDGDEQNPLPCEESMDTSVKIAKVLLENGCDPMALNDSKQSAMDRCIKTGNIKLIEYLINKGCTLKSEPDESNSTLLHSMATDLMNSLDMLAILKVFDKQKVGVNGVTQDFHGMFCNMAKVVDNSGLVPIILACRTYAHCQKCSYRSSEKSEQEAVTALWQCGRDFIKFLINDLKSDVSAFVHKKHDAENEKDQDLHDGLKSVVHYLADVDRCEYGNLREDSDPVYPCLRMILKYKPDVNVRDIEGHTPLTHAVQRGKEIPAEILLMEGNADPDSFYMTTIKEKIINLPVVILAAVDGNHKMMECLIRCGADVNAMDPRDQSSSLHHAITMGHGSEATMKMLSILVDGGATVNMVDDHKRTPLHLAVNLNPGHMDSNFDIEIFLMKHQANLNLLDIRGRLPLHYVFVKRKNHSDSSEDDPVDLCRLIVSNMKASELNVKDKFGQTCLHRAAFKGGKISCMYLMQKGLKIDVKDNDGNTPLAMAMLGSHDSCAAILIQNGASVKDPIYKVTGKQTMPDHSDSENESDIDEDEHDGARNKNEKVEQKPVWKWKPLHQSKVVEDSEKTPLFEMAVREEMQGVCFLVSEKSGVKLADAVEIGLKLQKYNVVLRLISTTVNLAPLKEKRKHGRNLLHILALTTLRFDHLTEKVVDALVNAGVRLVEKDDYGCTPLLYASLNRLFNHGRYFLKTEDVYRPKYKDLFNRSVLAVSLWKGLPRNTTDIESWILELLQKKGSLNELFDYPIPDYNLFGEAQLLSEPDYWQKYPQNEISPLIFAIMQEKFDFTKWLLNNGSNPNLCDNKKLTPLMYAAKVNDLNIVKVLLNSTFDPNATEEPAKPAKPLREQSAVKRKLHGRTFQLKKNTLDENSSEESSSEEEEKQKEPQEKEKSPEMKTVQKTSSVNVNLCDMNGWTVLHHIACPLNNGSFDNDEMVFVLHKVGLRLNTRNKDGNTALDLALRSGAAKVARMIQTLNNVDEEDMKSLKLQQFSVNDGVTWTSPPPSLHDDVDAVMQSLVDEPMEVDDEFIPQISPHCNVTNGTLAKDGDQGIVYSALLTKVDVKQGPYGLYNFYQLQLVYQPGKDLYILFTRWGRIGDEGQFQHTPYQEREDGIKEFCKVFKEKTGNKWSDVKDFKWQPKKYRLIPESMQRQASKQKDIEFEHKSSVRSKLPKHLYELMKELTNVKSIKAALNNEGMDLEVMPFGKMDRDCLLKARSILDEIGAYIKEVQEYRQKYDADNRIQQIVGEGMSEAEKKEKEEATSKYQSNCEKIAALSSEYFQIIPQKSYAFERILPLDRVNEFKKQMTLVSNLLDFEVASKMLLGAMYRKEEINPLDYIYQTMGCKLELLKEDDWESQYILKYMYSTTKSYQHSVEAIYRVEIPRGGKQMKKKDVGNRKLLWHGSGLANFLSILHRGLVVAPPEAPVTGHAFGKGIYFSDSFVKSFNYCWSPTRTRLMLLCEVALGKPKLFVSQHIDTELLEMGFDSIHAVGSSRPVEKHSVHLSTGVEMPLGNSEYNRLYVNGDICSLSTSEYVIFDENQVSVRYLIQFRE